jgi:hypothetical protein
MIIHERAGQMRVDQAVADPIGMATAGAPPFDGQRPDRS